MFSTGIRRLQSMLAKIALLLGVKIHVPVTFEDIIEPDADGTSGWRASLSSTEHPLNDVSFDVIVGANGQKRCLADFQRTKTAGRTAIAVTANFTNRRTTSEARVRETGSLSFVYHRDFFLDMRSKGVDLENFVYFKGETHYFVMTIKKESLLAKGVLKEVSFHPQFL